MKFDELDEKMRVFETAHDLCMLPGLYMVARLDGRGFTRLTKEVHPFDARFRDMMLAAAEHLMTGCGFSVIYGYTQSDEISLLFAHACHAVLGIVRPRFGDAIGGDAVPVAEGVVVPVLRSRGIARKPCMFRIQCPTIHGRQLTQVVIRIQFAKARVHQIVTPQAGIEGEQVASERG